MFLSTLEYNYIVHPGGCILHHSYKDTRRYSLLQIIQKDKLLQNYSKINNIINYLINKHVLLQRKKKKNLLYEILVKTYLHYNSLPSNQENINNHLEKIY